MSDMASHAQVVYCKKLLRTVSYLRSCTENELVRRAKRRYKVDLENLTIDEFKSIIEELQPISAKRRRFTSTYGPPPTAVIPKGLNRFK